MPNLGIGNGKLRVFDDSDPNKHATDPIGDTESIEGISRGQIQQKLLPLGLHLARNIGIKANQMLILILDNDSTSVGVIAAMKKLHCFCVLIGKSRAALLSAIMEDTGLTKAYTVDHKTKSLLPYDEVMPGNLALDTKSAWFTDNVDLATNGGMGFLTSGTCGKPKVVVYEWNAIMKQSNVVFDQIFKYKTNQPLRLVCGTSIAHAYSFIVLHRLLHDIDDGADNQDVTDTEVCLLGNNNRSLLQLLDKEANRMTEKKLTILFGSPGTYAVLLHTARRTKYTLNVDLALCAGTTFTLDLYNQMKQQLDVQVIQAYGTTETGNIAYWDMSPSALEKDRDRYVTAAQEQPPRYYLGNTVQGVELTQGPGDMGLLVRTPYHAVGYLRNRQLDSFKDKLHATSDRVTLEKCAGSEKRRVWLYGRMRSQVMIRDPRCPHNPVCSPDILEAALTQRDDITDAAVAVQHEDDRTSKIVVHIVCDKAKLAERVSTECQKYIAAWLATNNAAVPLDLVHVRVKDYLYCSPAGKLVYDLKA